MRTHVRSMALAIGAILVALALMGCPNPNSANQKSSDATLSGIVVTNFNLSPSFSATTTDYTVNVASDTTSVQLSASATDSAASIVYAIAGSPINPTSISLGAKGTTTTITITVTAQNGTTAVYKTNIYRPTETDATLASLSVDGYAISPGFAKTISNYSANITSGVTSAIVSAAASSANATIAYTVGGSAVDPSAVPIAHDSTTHLVIAVTAEDTTTTQTYNLDLIGQKETNANLSAVSLTEAAPSSGTSISFSPTFDASKTEYTATVASTVTAISIVATRQGSYSSFVYQDGNGTALASNTNIALVPGTNTVKVFVTAEDGTTTKTYTFTIVRRIDNNLTALSVSGYSLDQVFSATTLAYNVYLPAGLNSATLSATAATGSTAIYTSAVDTSVAGPKDVYIVVSNTDPSNVSKTYKVTFWCQGVTAQASILDSVNGCYLPVSSGITINVYTGSSTVPSQTVTATSNPQNLTLASGSNYRITANSSGRAQGTVEEATVGTKALLICHELEQSTFPATSPTIGSFQYTNASDPTDTEATWTSISSGVSIDLSTVTYYRIAVSGYSNIEPTSWSGFGVKLGIDQSPSIFTGNAAVYSEQSYDTEFGLFSTTSIFPAIPASTGTHTLNIVVYDRSGNRVARDVKIVNTASANSAGSDISADTFVNLLADYRSYGVTRDYFGKGSSVNALILPASGAASYRASVSFKFMTAASGGSNVPILGFRVERSDDGSSFVQVGDVNYGDLSAGSAGTHTFYDDDSNLTTGVSYIYRVTAYTDDTHTKIASTGSLKILPAHTASLVYPANKGTIDVASGNPDFAYSISDPSLWAAAVSDRYYFAPLIRSKDGNIVFYGEFVYVFASNSLNFRNGNSYSPVVENFGGSIEDYITFAAGTVTLKAALFIDATNWWNGVTPSFTKGATYEWDIFGQYAGSGSLGGSSNMTASWFQKSGANAISKSLADVYQNGQETLNGWFSFTAK